MNEQWRPFKVLHHVLGAASAEDKTVYEESDEGFFVSISETTSREYAVISTGDHITSEDRIIPLDNLFLAPKLIKPRQAGHEYDIDHQPGRFWIRSNDTHKNFRLAVVNEQEPSQEYWTTVIAGSDDLYITSFQSFTDRVVVSAREQGLDQVLLLENDGSRTKLNFPEAAYTAFVFGNPQPNPPQLRMSYSSLVTPTTTYDYDFSTGEFHVRKVRKVPSGYDQSQYQTERRMFVARRCSCPGVNRSR